MSFVELRISLDDGLLMYMEDEFMEVLEMGSWKFDYVQVYTGIYSIPLCTLRIPKMSNDKQRLLGGRPPGVEMNTVKDGAKVEIAALLASHSPHQDSAQESMLRGNEPLIPARILVTVPAGDSKETQPHLVPWSWKTVDAPAVAPPSPPPSPRAVPAVAPRPPPSLPPRDVSK